MKTNNTSESGRFTPRVLLACALCSAAVLLAMFSVLGWASTPPTSTIAVPTVAGETASVSWTGTIPPLANATSDCAQLADTPAVDQHMPTINVQGGTYDTLNAKFTFSITWNDSGNDEIITVLNPDGTELDSADTSDTTETVTAKNLAAGTYKVIACGFTNTTPQSYTGTLRIETSAGGPTGPPPPPPTPTPAPATAGVPRYYNYAPPKAIGEAAGEPSIGYNLFTHRAMYIAGLQTLRVTFPEDISPAGSISGACEARWDDVSYLVTKTKSLDPILFTDQRTGRTFVSQLNSVVPPASPVLIGLNSLMAFTDDDGANWTPAQVNPPDGSYDHQTVGAGPYPALLPLGNQLNKGDAVYYCSQAGVTAFCSRSDDGGLNFGRSTAIYNAFTDGCGGIHGHVKVAPDGTVYVPNHSCGGVQAVTVSEDAGVTWKVRKITGADFTATAPSVILDPSVGIATDGTLYVGYVKADGHAHVAVSKDKGVTWINDRDIGIAQNVSNAVFMESVAGDPLRAAVGFVGTTQTGNHEASDFNGTWYVYIAHTYDGGLTWTTVNATPDSPVQKEACIWNEGGSSQCRNLLDFNEITADEKGRVLYAYADGCVDECEAGGPNSFSSKATIARQSGGKGIFAAFDPVEPTTPQRACLFGRRDDQAAYLNWEAPDNGGGDITSYQIYRGTVPETQALIGTQVGNKTTYTDRSVDPNVATYYYSVQAVNATGSGAHSNTVSLSITPRVEFTGSCSLPGNTILNDPVGDESDGVAQHDITSVSMAEPITDVTTGAADNLIFTMKVVNLTTVPPGWRWSVRFTATGYNPPVAPVVGAQEDWFVSMISSDGAAPKFTYGTTGVYQGAARFFSTIGDLSPASNYNADGTITMVLPKELFRSKAVCTGTCPALAPGQAISIALGSVRASPPSEVPGSGGTNETIPDSTGASSYTLRPATLCLPNNPPLAVLTGSAGSGPAPLNVQFDGSRSKDDDSIDSIASYTFNFGDGGDDVTQTSPTITHPFNRGEYDVKLVVTDTRGKVSSNTAHFIVEAGMDETPSPTPTPSATATPTATPTPTASPSPSATATPTASPSPSATATPSATPTPTASPGARNVEFRNIATRVVVRGGDRTGIAGFILRGSPAKRVIVRGLGPSVPVNGRLADPIIELHDKDGALVAVNDNWVDSSDRDAIQASGLAPNDPKEAAIISDIDSGAHTAVLRGANGSTGIGLVDIYDLNSSSNSDLANVSTRAVVETSDNLLIGGFIVQGDIARRVVVRAIGPSLQASGITDSLQNPTLELHDGNGDLIMANDNWKDSQEAEIRGSGLQPSDDRESAIVQNLGPGAYTAVVRGAGGTTGTAVVEAYNVGP